MNQTIEKKTFAAPGLPRRFAAMVYDTLLVTALSFLYGYLVMGIYAAVKGLPTPGHKADFGPFTPLVLIGWFAVLIGFFCFFWHRSGQTLGMKTWRLSIRSIDGSLPSYRQCLIRCLCAPLSLVFLAAGYWLVYADPQRQTVHDRLSGTRTWLTAKAPKS